MLDHDALRLAGGAGRVDQVGQAGRRAGAGSRVVRRPRRQFGIAIEHQPGHGAGRDPVDGARLAQQRYRRAVGQDVGQPFRRIGRIERHVGGARLQDAEHGGQHVGRAFDAQRDAVVRAHAQRQQVVGDAVGARVERTVRVMLGQPGERQARRLRPRVGFEGMMQQLRARPRHGGGVEPVQHGQIVRVEQRQAPYRRGVVARHFIEQALPVAQKARGAGGVEQRGGVVQLRVQRAVAFGQGQCQVELGRLARQRHGGDRQAGQGGHGAAGRVVERQHDLEHRTVAEAARRLDRVNHLVERQVLVGLRIERRRFDLGQQAGHRHAAL